MINPQVSSSGLADWQAILEEFGLMPNQPRADATGQNHSSDTREPEYVNLSAFVNLLEQAGRRSRRPALGWTVGQNAVHATGGKIGDAVNGSKTVGSAMRRLGELMPLLQDACSLKLEVQDGWATLSYKILDPNVWPRHQEAIFSLGIYANMFRSTAVGVWNQVEVTLEADQELIGGDIAGLIGAEVIYGGETNILRFPARVLDSPMNTAPLASMSLISELKRDLVRKRLSTQMATRVEHLIYCDIQDGKVRQEEIARELGVSIRTLRRRLADEGTSFQIILDECRMRLAALEFQSGRKHSLSDIATKLGYSEQSNFTRAFSRWAGVPPHAYRQLTQ